MTPEDVCKRVVAIAQMVDDPEAAHSEEDTLYQDVLRAIGSGECSDPAYCARVALDTLSLEFERW